MDRGRARPGREEDALMDSPPEADKDLVHAVGSPANRLATDVTWCRGRVIATTKTSVLCAEMTCPGCLEALRKNGLCC